MFTIKVTPQESPFDIIAIAAEQYKKGMTAQGYNLWYTPYGKPEVWQGVGLFLGDVAYIENAAGKTIDKVEGFESRTAPALDPFPLPFGSGTANESLRPDSGVVKGLDLRDDVPGISHQSYESHYHLDDTAYLADGTAVKISGVLFSEGKVHYHLEGSIKAWDSCDLFDGPPAQSSSEIPRTFTQRTSEVAP